MKPTVTRGRLVEKRSDERDVVGLVNQIRDGVLNRTGTYNERLHTDDASPTTIWQMNLVPDTALAVDVVVSAYAASDGSAAAYKRFGGFKLFGGVSAQVGAIDSVDKEDVAGWDVALEVDGLSGVRLRVTGDAAREIEWLAHITCVEAPLENFG